MTIQSHFSPIAFSALPGSISAPVMHRVADDGREPWNQRAASGPDAKVPGLFYKLVITGKDLPSAQ